MSETDNRVNWSIDQRVEYERELAAQRAAWKEQQKQRKAQAELDARRSRLEAYLQRRSREWEATVGTPPPTAVVVGWQQEHMDAQHKQAEAEREAKLAEAEDLPHYPPHV